MKRFFKTLMFFGGTALAAHFGMKAFKRVNGIVKLSKSLPEFLSNVYGEMPKMNINRSLNFMRIEALFSKDIIDKHDDIENTIREYIDDFYPEVAKCAIDIEVNVKGEECSECTECPECVSADNTSETTEDKE